LLPSLLTSTTPSSPPQNMSDITVKQLNDNIFQDTWRDWQYWTASHDDRESLPPCYCSLVQF
jgi:hypothetical protein